MNIADLSKPLSIDQIDFRIQSINRGGYATILAYKDARVDINRLNAVCGQLGWERSHSRDNRNCTVSIYNKEIGQWVSKEDTGNESMADAQKGLASDSFKRACFNWGIGLELYDYPVIQIQLNGGGDKPQNCEWYLNQNKKDRYGNPTPTAGYNLRLKDWVWFSQFTDNKLTYLAATDGTLDSNGKSRVRFAWGRFKKDEQKTTNN